MRLRTVALGVVACGLAVFARRLAAEVAEPAPVVMKSVLDARILNEVARIVRVDHARDGIESVVEDEPSADEPDEQAVARDRRQDRLDELRVGLDPTRGVLHGQVRDSKTNEPLAGVTITAGKGQTFQSAISDENGYYEIEDLEPGEYLATYYYVETTVEHPGITVVADALTSTDQALDTSSHPGITINTEGLVFGDPDADEYGDGVGVSISGVTTLENHYVIEGE